MTNSLEFTPADGDHIPAWKSDAWSEVFSMLHFDVDAVPEPEPARHGWLLDALLGGEDLTQRSRSALLQLVLDMVDRGIALERLNEDGEPEAVTDIGHHLVSKLHHLATTKQVYHLVTHYANSGNFDFNEFHSTGAVNSSPRSLLETAILRSSPGAAAALLDLGVNLGQVPARSIGLSHKGSDGSSVFVVVEPGDLMGYVQGMFEEGSEMLGVFRSWQMLRDIADQHPAAEAPPTMPAPSAGRRRLL